MTQADLGRRLGVSQQTIAKWESGETSVAKHVEAIAELLELSVDEVLDLQDRPGLALAAGPGSAFSSGETIAQRVLERMLSGPMSDREVDLARDLLGSLNVPGFGPNANRGSEADELGEASPPAV